MEEINTTKLEAMAGSEAQGDEKKPFVEPKLTFVEPKLVKHGKVQEVTAGFFGTFSP